MEQEKTLIFGHRGYPAKFPENSLAGFKYACEHGIDGVEFDVHLTKDGIPVIMHDEKIDRTTNGTGLIKQMSFEELSNFRLTNGEKIPKLIELLELLVGRDLVVNLEFKTDKIAYPNIERTVLTMVNKFALLNPVIYSSFNLQTLKNCQKILPAEQYCWLTESKVKDPITFIAEEKLAGLHPKHYLDENIVQRIWTIDDEKTARFLLSKHVAGIFTNRFEQMMQLKHSMDNI